MKAMMQPCSLLSLATAVPPQVVEQTEAKVRAREAFGGNKALFDRLAGVFDNAGIARRHIVAPQDWYMSSHGWRDRNNLYLEACERLFAEAATAAFGDGAAAAVVTSGEHSLARIKGSAEKLWPNTQRIMGWDVEDPGLAVVFDRAIPPFIEENLADAVDDMCAQLGIAREDID